MARSTVSDGNVFGKLAEAVCRNNLKNETWLNVYGNHLFDPDTDIDERCSQHEFSHAATALVEPLLEVNAERDLEVLLKGLHTLDSLLFCGEYPPAELTMAIFEIIKKAMDGAIDSKVTTAAFRIMAKLLRYIPPSTATMRQYWISVISTAFCSNFDRHGKAPTDAQLRNGFIDCLKRIAQVSLDENVNMNGRHAATAYFRLICELLEFDFLFFLRQHSDPEPISSIVGNKEAPVIAAILWPGIRVGGSAIIDKHRMQAQVLKPINELMTTFHDAQIHDACARLLAMIFELVRLTDEKELVDVVTFEKVPDNLYWLLCHLGSEKEMLQRFSSTVAFSWLRKAIRDQQESKQ